MAEYWYAYKHQRGFGLGCQPKGFSNHDEKMTEYGAVAYPFELNSQDVFQYDLEIIKVDLSWMDIIRKGVD